MRRNGDPGCRAYRDGIRDIISLALESLSHSGEVGTRVGEVFNVEGSIELALCSVLNIA